MTALWTTTGEKVELGVELGRGGEGAVYEVAGRPDVVAKVYHRAAAPEKAQKLEEMAAVPPGALHAVTAWPRAAVRNHPSGPVQGFVMPAIRGHKAAHLLYSPRSRRMEFTGADYRFLVHVAGNVARAFAIVHKEGHVIGDVNHSGVLVGGDGTARLIDCDSFQVRLSGRTFRCAVGVPEYTPPELQGLRLTDVPRSTDHDSFGLAVMVFHLLFMGWHPYSGRYLGGGQMPVARAIKEGRFAFGPAARRSHMAPPPHAPPLLSASNTIADLFVMAFTAPGRRPTPALWTTALSGLANALVTCDRDRRHVFWGGLPTCPWCHLESAAGTSLFGGRTEGAKSGRPSPLNAAEVWREIEGVPSPSALLKPAMPSQPSPDARKLRKDVEAFRASPSALQKAARAMALAAGAACLVATAFLFEMGSLWALVTGVLGAWAIADGRKWRQPLPKVLKAQVTRLKEDLTRAEKVRRKAEASVRALGTSEFSETHATLKRAHDRLTQIRNEEAKALEDVRRDAEAQKRAQHLARFVLSTSSVKGVGAAKVQALAARGVRTAADVERWSVRSVPGIGPELADRLLGWRRAAERGFRFDPTSDVPPSVVNRVNAKFAGERARLERELQEGPASLRRARERTEAKRGALVRDANVAAAVVAQLEANLRHVRAG